MTRTSRSAFTLLELMVSLTLGGIAITSIYAVGAASTRTFRQQQQVASAQSSLRIALGQVKRDFARAGFLGTPSAAMSTSCGTVSSPLHDPVGNGSLAAIAHYENDFCSDTSHGCDSVAGVASGAGASVSDNRTSGFTADAVVMIGNYETASEYAGVTLLPDGATISIGPSWHSYQTDFMSWQNGQPNTFDPAAFRRVFPQNRLIRIRTTKGQYHFAKVASVTDPTTTGTLTDAQIAFTPAVPGLCAGDVDGAWVAPLNAIRYFPRDEPASVASAATAQTFGPMAQLVRQEVDVEAKGNVFTDGTASPPPRVVLDYLVAFRLGFVMNAATAPSAIDNYSAGVVSGNVNTNPERLRAVRIELAARTPEQDNGFPWSAGDCANMRCFRVFADRPGAARVRTVRAEVFIPNVAFEGF